MTADQNPDGVTTRGPAGTARSSVDACVATVIQIGEL